MKAIDWTSWQLADSAFPAGGFAHSSGLESAWRQGLVEDARSLERFLCAALVATGHGLVPFLVTAHAGNESLEQVDSWCEAFLANHVTNRASRAQGRAFLAAVEAAYGLPEITSLRDAVAEGDLCGHQAPLFGHTAALLGLPRERAVMLFLYIQLRDTVSAAIRLNIVGPLAGQSLLSHLSRFVEQLAEQSLDRPLAAAAQTSPVIELVAQRHDRLYSRLFQS